MISKSNRQECISSLSGKLRFLIFATTLVVRMACMVVFQTWDFPDEWRFGFEMGQLGRWLAEGRGFSTDGKSLTSWFPPIYPLVVGGAFAMFGVYSQAAAVALFLFQSTCAAVSAVCLAVLGNRLISRQAGLLAGCIWAFYPSSIWYSAIRIWYTELSAMLVLLAATVAVTGEFASKPSRFALLGGLSGLAMLTDSTTTIYLGLLLLWICFARGVPLSKMVVGVVVWAILAVAVITPWSLRNWYTFGTLSFVKSNFGRELFAGNNDLVDGSYQSHLINQALAELDQKELAHYRSQSEFAYSRYLQDKALAWIRANPSKFILMTTRRLWYFWGRLPKQTGIHNSWQHFAYYGPCLILALCGLWYGIRNQWQLAPIWLFLLVYPLPFYLTYISVYRYRYPVEPFVILLATIPLSIWFRRRPCAYVRT